jgi:NAD(P)-dependent dehydrogenase (short-subunit alcohol dehydrogenase family)
MKDLHGKTAVITGAASGIGRMLAVNLADEGCSLALADLDGRGLDETASMVAAGVRVSTHVLDVSRREDVAAFAKEATTMHKGVDIVINDAGVGVGDFLETVPIEDFEWVMGVNFWGAVYMTTAFLPHLRTRPEGHIVNISSINGILPNPNNGPYCASKSALKGYTETLAQELEGTNIAVSCVFPGGVRTNIVRNSRFNRGMYSITKDAAVRLYDDELFRTTPQKAARTIVSGIKRGRPRILVGADAVVLDLLTRLFPGAALRLSTVFSRRLTRKYAAAAPFEGDGPAPARAKTTGDDDGQ